MVQRPEAAKFSVTISSNAEPVPEDLVYPLVNDKEMLVGKADHCEIKCFGDLICPEHCYIRAIGDEIWLTDNYTPYGCFTKVEPQKPVQLTGNGFCLGNTVFTILRKDKDECTLLKEGLKGTEKYELDPKKEPTFFIGRDAADQIKVPEDDTISSHHAQVRFDIAIRAWTIKDHGRKGTGSSNGTWVKLSTATTVVNPGDTARIGKECFLCFKRI